MFDLSTIDVFKAGDVLCSFRKGDETTANTFLDLMKSKGMEIWAFSDRGEYVQYLLVPDIAMRRAIAIASDQNSAGGLIGGDLKDLIGVTAREGTFSGKLVV